MNFDWLQFLNLARELENQHTPLASEEAKHRTSASRAYYSVRTLAYDYAISHGGRDKIDRHDHGAIWRWFKQQDDSHCKKIGEELKTLYGYRRKADYDDSVSSADKKAYFTITLAEEIKTNLTD